VLSKFSAKSKEKTMAYYDCYFNNLNGSPCKRKATRSVTMFNHDPEQRKFVSCCLKHERDWQSRKTNAFSRALSAHDQGMHGEGEDREAFLLPEGEFSVTCSKCRDELTAEKYGVKPEDAHQAVELSARMERAIEAGDAATESVIASIRKSGLVYALHWAGSSAEKVIAADNWRKVKAMAENADNELNLVSAYNRMREILTSQLIDNTLDESQRKAASDFIRGW